MCSSAGIYSDNQSKGMIDKPPYWHNQVETGECI